MSINSTGARVRPGLIPGARITNGTLAECSNNVCFVQDACSPKWKPWSELNNTIVSAFPPRASSASNTSPDNWSTHDTHAMYPRTKSRCIATGNGRCNTTFFVPYSRVVIVWHPSFAHATSGMSTGTCLVFIGALMFDVPYRS